MRHHRSPFLIGYLAITLGLSPIGLAPAFANPQGGTVAGGSATIAGQGTSTVTVTQTSDRAIINWNTFNIGAGELTRFIQPGANSIMLDRVTGGLGPSQIFGTIQANGRVFLVNPNGVLFGQGAVIDTAGFLATTNDIQNADFMGAGSKFNFTIPGNPAASVVNLGTITATNGGIAALVAPGVRNSGTITADFGKVAMASGNGFTLDFYGDKLITLQVGDQIASQVTDVATGLPLDTLVKNEGLIKANGGRVELSAVAARQVVDAVINNTGVIEANSVGTRNGMIVLSAATAANKGAGAPTQTVKVSGKLSAAGRRAGETGGKIQITGENIAVSGAKINASGKAGGGKVLIGGDVGGGNGNAAVAGIAQAALESTPVATASSVSVDAGTRIDVSAKDTGNGGKLVIWSDHLTDFAGSFQARGGANGGNGGFAEISSHGQLNYNGFGDLRAPAGKFGTLLLDPYDLMISNGADSTSSGFAASANNSVINVNTLLAALASGNVVVTTGDANSAGTQSGNINVAAQLAWSQATTLTLVAASDITIAAAISAQNGGLTLNAGANISATAAVNVGTFTLQNGAWSQVDPNLPAFSATDFRIVAGSFLRALGGDGSSGSPYQITDVYGLQGIGSGATLLSQNYALANNIDASGTAAWNGGAGFVPVGGSNSTPFVGAFNGQGNAISNLAVNYYRFGNYGNLTDVGLFGVIGAAGSVNSLFLNNVTVNTGTNSQNAGALAGSNYGMISNVSASGTIGSTVFPSSPGQVLTVGGLVGVNGGTITQSFAAVTISADAPTHGLATEYGPSPSSSIVTIGGLVGLNTDTGSIAQSYSSGAVGGTGNTGYAGGFVGKNEGQISSAYALGSVGLGANYSTAGGFVGQNDGSITQAYASGAVSAGANAGGFAGANGGTVAQSFWDVATTGQSSSAGGIGLTNSAPWTQGSYAGFDFTNTWFMIDGQTRPFLRSEWSTNITNAHQLQLMTLYPTASYTLTNNVSFGTAFTNPSDMWGPGGFVPIASVSTPFTGSFNGQGYTIDGLKIAPIDLYTNSIGLFAAIGSGGAVSNLTLSDVKVSANTGLSPDIPGQFIGALAGQNAGWISNVHVVSSESFQSTVDGLNMTGVIAGGLVGQNGIFNYQQTSDSPSTETLGRISRSSADVAVTVGNGCGGDCNGWNYAGGLVGFNPGTIWRSNASGNVSVGANAFGGGLVGTNQNYDVNNQPISGAVISRSWASGAVDSSGNNVAIGGLVGYNAQFSRIRDSHATGDVTATVPTNIGTDCGGGNCVSVNAGGLVGQNDGTIEGRRRPHVANAAPTDTDAPTIAADSRWIDLSGHGLTYATGAVSVGSQATGGGLVGQNSGRIENAFATGAVTGDAGKASDPSKLYSNTTKLGGLVGSNSGTIDRSLAFGAVGQAATESQAATSMLTAGGLVGDNSGSIRYSTAYGMVSAGDASVVGGLVGGNAPSDNGDCIECSHGGGGTIVRSRAFGDVTAGDSSVAGGLAGYNGGTVSRSRASGDVTVGSNASAGGLVGINQSSTPVPEIHINADLPTHRINGAVISRSSASGNVTSDGTNVALGGLVGANGANAVIRRSHASGDVTSTGSSDCGDCNVASAGGLVGQNAGTISRSSATGDVTVASNAFAGGLVGLNQSLFSNSDSPWSAGAVISRSWASGNVTSDGINVAIGGLVGANGANAVIRKSHAGGHGEDATTVSATNSNDCSQGCGMVSAGGLVGQNAGAIWRSSADVDVSVHANASAGGLVGSNQNYADGQSVSGAVIGRSWASGNVTSDGINVAIGGLVGYNGPGAWIMSSSYVNTSANGGVSSTAAVNQNVDCSTSVSCQFADAGGLVGQNQGTVRNVFANTTVSVGSNGTGGGLIGWNDGIVIKAIAKGDVTGAAGSYGLNGQGSDTALGGLIGDNQGIVAYAVAFGNVGSSAVDNLRVGGLVGENTGTILNSLYRNKGAGVQAGSNSSAGGLIGENGNDCNNCTPTVGDGYNNAALVFGSGADTHVTVGSGSVAGGLAATGNGVFAKTWARGTVTGGDNSVLGGLVGAISIPTNGTPPATTSDPHAGTWNGLARNVVSALSPNSDSGSWSSALSTFSYALGISYGVTESYASVAVTSTGSNSVVGGLVGANGGTVANSWSSGAVVGTSDSFLGGLVGVNIGLVQDSSTTPSASVTGQGGNNLVGGLVGLNLGTIDPSYANGPVSSGSNSFVGSLIGANAEFVNFIPGQILGSQFPVGTYTPDSVGSGTVNGGPGPQVGASNPTTGLPSNPSIVQGCYNPLCQALNTGIFGPLDQNSPVNQPPPLQLVVNQNTNNLGGSPPSTPINLTQGTPPSGGNPPGNNGGNNPPPHNNGPPPGYGIGRTLSEQQFSGVPPIGETRFLPGEVVVQISNTVPADQIAQLAKQFGFTIISSQVIGGRTIYDFKATNGQDIRVLIRALEKNHIVASAQPNYLFNLAQDAEAPVPQLPPQSAPPPAGDPSDVTGSLPPSSPELSSDRQPGVASLATLPAGDAGQYTIDKLHLGAVHARALGRNVTVAVIDSEIDVQHPDLQGVIAEQYDATSGTASSPHAHGTGMAGAIASRRRLLGIAPGVRILAVKAFDETSTSAEATSFQILKGLDWAISRHVRIINMSFAGPRDLMMERSLQTAFDQGIVLIAAAGNAGPKSPPLYPAADANVIAVSATDYSDKPFAMANHGKYIAVAAPGVDVLVPAPKGGYQLTTGTSVAAAHVSGVAALLLESRPTLGPRDVRSILMSTAHLINPKGKDDITGAGLVDPYQALTFSTARAVDTVPASRTTVH